MLYAQMCPVLVIHYCYGTCIFCSRHTVLVQLQMVGAEALEARIAGGQAVRLYTTCLRGAVIHLGHAERCVQEVLQLGMAMQHHGPHRHWLNKNEN